MTHTAAVVGCGGIARAHAAGYRSVADVDLAACADPSRVARETFASEFGVENVYADAGEMMAAIEPEIVSICTWPPTHAELTETVCRGGARVVFCEKPMAVDLAAADRMIAVAQETGTLLLVNHQRRFARRYVEARRLLESGAIGSIQEVKGRATLDVRTNGTHVLDIVRYLLSDRPVHGVLAAVDMGPNPLFVSEFITEGTLYGHPVETSALVFLVCEDGVRIHLDLGQIARPEEYVVAIDGADGRMEIGGEDWYGGGSLPLRYRTDSGAWVVPDLGHQDPVEQWTISIQCALEVAETGGSHPLNADSARADVEIVMAMFESTRRRAMVKLPLLLTESPLEVMLAVGETSNNQPPSIDEFARLGENADAASVEAVANLLFEECRYPPGSYVGTPDVRALSASFGPALTEGQYQCLDAFARLHEVH